MDSNTNYIMNNNNINNDFRHSLSGKTSNDKM